MKSILFVCTRNIFRSVSAKYAPKWILGGQNDYRVASAGTVAHPQAMHPFIRDRLFAKRVDPSEHRRKDPVMLR